MPRIEETERRPGGRIRLRERSFKLPARPVIFGALFCALSLLVGYQWGQTDRAADDEEFLEATRKDLLNQLDREREQFDAEREALEAAQRSDTHEGPAGLRWGQPPQTVRSRLSQRFQYLSDGTSALNYVQRYSGTFAKLPTDEIRAEFCKAQLSGLVITLSNSGPSPYRSWRDALETIRDQYGEPTMTVRPAQAQQYEASLAQLIGAHGTKAALADSGLNSQLGDADKAVMAGDQPLRAEWELLDKVSLVLAAHRLTLGADGQPRVALSLSFDKPDLSAPCHPQADGKK